MNLHFVSLLSFLIWSHPQVKVQNHHSLPFQQQVQSWEWLKSIWIKLKIQRPKPSQHERSNPLGLLSTKINPPTPLSGQNLLTKRTSKCPFCQARKQFLKIEAQKRGWGIYFLFVMISKVISSHAVVVLVLFF